MVLGKCMCCSITAVTKAQNEVTMSVKVIDFGALSRICHKYSLLLQIWG
jgi:hypothetical protein